MPSYVEDSCLDVIIVGAGFGGCYLLRNLRKQGFRVRVFEEGLGLGGVWWHNRYPGARVDTDTPFYEFSDPEIWQNWEWTEKFPSQPEMIKYFEFVDKKWDLSKDVTFGVRVTDAAFDAQANEWTIETSNGQKASSTYLLLAMGFAAKMYVPDIKGLDKFQGFSCHTARWPEDHPDLANKRIGIIGSGATGVQLVQELGPAAGQLVVFQRSPNCAMPMRQETWGLSPPDKSKYSELFPKMKMSKAGFTYPIVDKSALDDTPEQRKALFEHLWELGGFAPTHGNYSDLNTSLEANHLFYDFWRDKVRQRLTTTDPELIENLAPEKPPYPFGTKRSSLEQSYYEVFNQSNVSLVSLKKNPIDEIVPEGVKMSDGTIHQLDALLLATGFDAITGSFTRVNIRGLKGKSLNDKWKTGSRTFLGMTSSGFPNMFFLYGPQSPTATAIGPVISEIQGDWIIQTLVYLRKNGFTRLDPRPDTEKDWGRRTTEFCDSSLLSHNETTWYMGGNVPGKAREALSYMGGLPAYQWALNECASNGLSGFNIQ
ncbi:cyclohexanone monooxygenase [Colletotrichum truncatum]|uniref:Cyclohexanone monooxygenase n=1 Tax=Colletotrichum truncatum TaxID=5467 RepID=A0ACC3YJQ2_COLTU|nr:cyclohexanone monooxygenase [Colletotrichum truncatum]KAF6785984.1 cyclohexanone monooxygenase [Colletotrichum truncatum]